MNIHVHAIYIEHDCMGTQKWTHTKVHISAFIFTDLHIVTLRCTHTLAHMPTFLWAFPGSPINFPWSLSISPGLAEKVQEELCFLQSEKVKDGCGGVDGWMDRSINRWMDGWMEDTQVTSYFEANLNRSQFLSSLWPPFLVLTHIGLQNLLTILHGELQPVPTL